MQLRIFTLAFSHATGGFPDEVVRRFLVGKDVLSITDHFFQRDGLPYLTFVVRYAGPDDAREPAVAIGGAETKEAGASRGDGDVRALLREADWPVFKALKAWRSERSRRDGVPPYVVATNRMLAEIAVQRPQSKAALGSIAGFGESKVARYADDLLKLLPRGPDAALPAVVPPASAAEATS